MRRNSDLIGSTEWVEKHEEELKSKAVAYFNSDTNGKADFSAGGSPSLHVFMRQIVRDVLKPEKLDFKMPAVGSGSDYVAVSSTLGNCKRKCGLRRFGRRVSLYL